MRRITSVLTVLVFAGWAGSASAVPITGVNIVTVGSTDWAQVDLFTGLSWSDINSSCPAGVCTNGGTLNGYDMTNYLWADTEDVNELFNGYIGSSELGPGPDLHTDSVGTFATAFFADGWRVTDTLSGFGNETNGFISDDNSRLGAIADLFSLGLGFQGASTQEEPGLLRTGTGGWFYRAEGGEVPAPATIPLIALGLAALGFSRRKEQAN